LYYINLKIIYISKNNEIEKIKNESLLLSSPNYISREQMLGILKNNSIDNERRYTLLSILKYIITLEPEDIKTFLNTPEGFSFLHLTKNIDAIHFEKTISMFQDLNELILIFYENTNTNKIKNVNTITKRIFLRSLGSKKKTIKKQYKEFLL